MIWWARNSTAAGANPKRPNITSGCLPDAARAVAAARRRRRDSGGRHLHAGVRQRREQRPPARARSPPAGGRRCAGAATRRARAAELATERRPRAPRAAPRRAFRRARCRARPPSTLASARKARPSSSARDGRQQAEPDQRGERARGLEVHAEGPRDAPRPAGRSRLDATSAAAAIRAHAGQARTRHAAARPCATREPLLVMGDMIRT